MGGVRSVELREPVWLLRISCIGLGKPNRTLLGLSEKTMQQTLHGRKNEVETATYFLTVKAQQEAH
jgi:hypothetical protein